MPSFAQLWSLTDNNGKSLGPTLTSCSCKKHLKFRLPCWEVAKPFLQRQKNLSAEWRKMSLIKIISSTPIYTTRKHIILQVLHLSRLVSVTENSCATNKAVPLSQTKLHTKKSVFSAGVLYERCRWDLNPVLTRLHCTRSSFPEMFTGEVFRILLLSFPPLAF